MCPVARCRRGLRRDPSGSALPTLPQSVPRGTRFSRLHWFAFATACQVARPPWTDRTKFPWSTGDFYIQASDGSVALPAAGYDYNSHWTPLLAGLSPAGMAASLAAPDLIERDLGFGLEGDRRGHACRLAPGWIITPPLRKIEAIGDRQTAGVMGEGERHRHLAIVLLAELAAILTRHPDRVPALLGEAGIVDDP